MNQVEVATVFDHLQNDLQYRYCFEFGTSVFEFSTSNKECNDCLLLNGDFLSKRSPDYRVRLYDQPEQYTNIDLERYEDEVYFYDVIQIHHAYFTYRKNKQSNDIDVLLPSTFEDWELEHLLKVYFSSISLQYNAILLHASAIVKDGKAQIFTGLSGAGKSTIAELSGLPIIHEETMLLSPIDEHRFRLESIPFRRDYKKLVFEGEIENIFRIFQDKDTYLKDISDSLKLAHVLSALWSFNVFHHDKKRYNAQIIEYCEQLCQRINVGELYFRRNNDFLNLI